MISTACRASLWGGSHHPDIRDRILYLPVETSLRVATSYKQGTYPPPPLEASQDKKKVPVKSCQSLVPEAKKTCTILNHVRFHVDPNPSGRPLADSLFTQRALHAVRGHGQFRA